MEDKTIKKRGRPTGKAVPFAMPPKSILISSSVSAKRFYDPIVAEGYIDTILRSKASKGRNLIIKYLQGQKLTPKQSKIAKCCDCMAFYHDGRIDCEVRYCPLYPTYPYRRD
jgi:hypothetical protein